MTTYRYHSVSHLAIDSLTRCATNQELAWLVGHAEIPAPTLHWWRPAQGFVTGEVRIFAGPTGGFYLPNTLNTVSLQQKASDPSEVPAVRSIVRHEFAHHLEARLGWSRTIAVYGEAGLHSRAVVCSHLARRWSKRRPSPVAVRLLGHWWRLSDFLDDLERVVGDLHRGDMRSFASLLTRLGME